MKKFIGIVQNVKMKVLLVNGRGLNGTIGKCRNNIYFLRRRGKMIRG
jgi:sRNA-binding regulator protein Hfq